MSHIYHCCVIYGYFYCISLHPKNEEARQNESLNILLSQPLVASDFLDSACVQNLNLIKHTRCVKHNIGVRSSRNFIFRQGQN